MNNNLGLVSISFRSLTPEQICEAVNNAGLSNIEWGADVHCKPLDISASDSINTISDKSGICSCAYGSYYRVGAQNTGNADFADILSAAKRIKTGIIRVWAGVKGSAEITAAEYTAVVDDMRRICGMAAAEDIKISLECHNNTLTDDYKSALTLLDDVSCGNLTMYWQPNQYKSLEYNLESASALGEYITNIHVFNWDKAERFPLSEAVGTWKRYVEIIERNSKHGHKYLLEFMPRDTVEELCGEAAALKKIFE